MNGNTVGFFILLLIMLAATKSEGADLSTTEHVPREYLLAHEMIPPTMDEEFHCLVQNTYFEARNQSKLGQMLIAHVVFNRVDDDRFPNTICGVVYQSRWTETKYPVRHKCHFSWFCDGLSDDMLEPSTVDSITNTMRTALELYNRRTDLSDGSTHYHSLEVTPFWVHEKTYTMTVDDHKFYAWR